MAPDVTDVDRLPELAWTTDVAGGVTQSAAQETGLVVGTAVIVGTIDAAAEAISVGVVEVGEMMLMYGSTVFTILVVDKRNRDRSLWHAPWLFPGQHACMAELATSGTLTHWFVEQFAQDLDQETAMARLAADAAASPPGSNGTRRPALFLR